MTVVPHPFTCLIFANPLYVGQRRSWHAGQAWDVFLLPQSMLLDQILDGYKKGEKTVAGVFQIFLFKTFSIKNNQEILVSPK